MRFYRIVLYIKIDFFLVFYLLYLYISIVYYVVEDFSMEIVESLLPLSIERRSTAELFSGEQEGINEWSMKITRKPLFRLSILHTGGSSHDTLVATVALIIQTFGTN